jgi:FkbM family methyltransferase
LSAQHGVPVTNTLRRIERGLLHSIEIRVDGEIKPNPILSSPLFAYLRWRQTTVHWMLTRGHAWVASPLRLALAFGLGRGDVCFDIGANIGRVAQEAAWRVGPLGRVVCFEPSASSAERLRRRARRLRLDQIEVHQVALGARRGRAVLFEHAHRDGGSSSLVDPHTGDADGLPSDVAIETLDDVAVDDSRPRPTLVKLDVEGSEVDVLEGGRRFFGARPLLVVEIYPEGLHRFGRAPDDLIVRLRDYGYTLYRCEANRLATVATADDLPVRRRQDVFALDPVAHAPVLEGMERGAARRARRR